MMQRFLLACTVVLVSVGCGTYVPRHQDLRFGSVRAATYRGVAKESPQVQPGEMQPFVPFNDREAYLIRRADFAYFPNDFRQAPLFDPDRVVAWSSVVLEATFESIEGTGEMFVNLLLDHRYYDFVLYRHEVPFALSERGEGPLMIGWRTVDSPANRRDIDDWVGMMMIIYGSPRRVVGNGVIEMVLHIYRYAYPAHFSTGADYGREAVIKPAHLVGEEGRTDEDA